MAKNHPWESVPEELFKLESTGRQLFLLKQRTGHPWEENPQWINRGEASALVGMILAYMRKSTPPDVKDEITPQIEAIVRLKTGDDDWDITKLNTDFIPTKSKRKSRRSGSENEGEESEQKQNQGSEGDEQGEGESGQQDMRQKRKEERERRREERRRKRQEEKEQKEQEEREKQEREERERKEEEERMKKQWGDRDVPEWYIKPDCFDRIATLVESGEQICLVGPAGCGKSLLARIVAECIDYDIVVLSFSGGVRYSQIFGTTKIQDGNSFFEPRELVKAACLTPIPEGKKGRLIIIDEIFGADPDVGLGLNSMTEIRTRMFYGPDGEYPVLDGVVFMATSNSTGRQRSKQYTGVQRADDSLLSRFATTELFDYDTAVEELILENNIGLQTALAKHVAKGFADMRMQCTRQNIAFDACTRRLEAAGRLVKAGMSVDDAVRSTVGNVLSYSEREKLGLNPKDDGETEIVDL